jgi:hypothetical protein
MPPLLEVRAVFARAELGQIGRKMVRNDLIGTSLGYISLIPALAPGFLLCGKHDTV